MKKLSTTVVTQFTAVVIGLSTLILCSVLAQAQTVIPTNFALPKSAKDTTKPGFIWNVFQNSANQANNNQRTEDALAGLLVDTSGSPLLNEADPAAQGVAIAPGTVLPGTVGNELVQFEIATVINMSRNGTDNAGNFTPDNVMPGIPGTGGSTDGIAGEVLTWLELDPGIYTMGVNSDDGFRLAIGGASPKDLLSVVVGQFDGGRGAANTDFQIQITQAGLYAARLIWEQGGGGANVEWSAFSSSGTRLLINSTNGIKAWRAVTGAAPPYFRKAVPLAGPNAAFDTLIDLELVDGGSPISVSSVKLSLDATQVAATVTKTNNVTYIKYNPNTIFTALTTHTISIDFNDGSAKNLSYQFTIGPYITLGTADGVTADTTKPGFLWRVHQQFDQNNTTDRTERQLAGFLGPNLADPAAQGVAIGPGKTNVNPNLPIDFEIGATLNISRNGTDNAGDFMPDDVMPGIPGTTASTDGIAAEILYYMDLPVGVHTLIVNSDDGFRTTGGNVRDIFRAQFGGEFNGGRGAADSPFKINVVNAGVYAFRTIWEQGGGGANIELIRLKPDGTNVLLNDTANGGFTTYRAATAGLPIAIRNVSPAVNATGVFPNSSTIVSIQDGNGTNVLNTSTVVLKVDGNTVAVTPSKVGDTTTITYAPPAFYATGSKHTNTLSYTDGAATRTESWSFTVIDYAAFPVIPPSFAAPSGTVDLSKPGFDLFMHQINVGRPGGNNLPAPLNDIDPGFIDPNTGLLFDNMIDNTLDAAMWNGFVFTEPGTINYNQDSRNNPAAGAGNFVPDKPMPGIPSAATAPDDNYTMRTTTYLQLKAGLYRFGVNSDDGFVVEAGVHPKDGFRMELGNFDGGRGAADTLFNFRIVQDGLYPFTLYYWEGGGGSAVEFFSVDGPTGRRSLINDRPNTNAIQSYRQGPSRPYVRSVSPVPGNADAARDKVEAVITDGGLQVVDNSIQLSVDGTAVAALTPSRSGTNVTVRYDVPGGLTVGQHTATLVFRDSGTPATVRTNDWKFTVVNSLPKVLLKVTGVDGPPYTPNPNASDLAAKARLEALGFDVVVSGQRRTDVREADGKVLIVISSTVGSGNLNNTFRDTPVPVLFWEPALMDDFEVAQLAGGGLAAQTDLIIANATHPIAAGLSAGTVTVVSSPIDFNAGDPVPSGTVVATLADGGARPAIIAFDTGAALYANVTAPARRVFFFFADNTAALVNNNGGLLFDNAIKWLAPVAPSAPRFSPVVLANGSFTLSWTGTGTLQQTDSLSPPNWQAAPSQANPQPITPAATGTRFYRVRSP